MTPPGRNLSALVTSKDMWCGEFHHGKVQHNCIFLHRTSKLHLDVNGHTENTCFLCEFDQVQKMQVTTHGVNKPLNIFLS